MTKKEAPQQLDRENLEKLPLEKLVDMVLKSQELVLKQNETIGHWCSLIKGEKRYGVRLRGNGEIIKT